MDTKVGKQGWGDGMNWEIEIDIYTLICIKEITDKNLLYSPGDSTSLRCMVETNTTL